MLYSKEKLEQLRHRWTTTQGKRLIKIIKENHCYLSPVLFKEKIRGLPGMNDKEMRDTIDLRGINLCGFDFRTIVKEEDDGFPEKIAVLSNIHFEGAFLKHCNFENGKIHDCHFECSDLSHSELRGATLNSCSFHEADCASINLRGAKLIDCNFTATSIKDIILDTTIVDQKTTFGEVLRSEREKNYHFASIEYKQIKEMYKNSSLHNIADEYHYKEMVAKRKIAKKSNPIRFFNYIFGDLLCKYGTSYLRVLLWSAVIMVTCALIININESLLYYKTEAHTTFLDSLYFSMVTFTTLGYGDYHAVGLFRFMAAIESFIGAALMALFTVIVARNIIRD